MVKLRRGGKFPALNLMRVGYRWVEMRSTQKHWKMRLGFGRMAVMAFRLLKACVRSAEQSLTDLDAAGPNPTFC